MRRALLLLALLAFAAPVHAQVQLGDRAVGSIVDCVFYTRAEGAPITLAGTPSVRVYKGNSTTESTAGVTLVVDFDGQTGTHHVRVDSSADGAFYSAGATFFETLGAGTVDGVSVVGSPVCLFSLQAATVVTVTGNVGGNVTGSIGSLATQAKADVNAEADAALLDVGVTATVTGRIDAAITSRLSSAGYTAPDNASVTAIKAKTDLIPAGGPAAATDYTTARAVKLDNLDTTVSSRLPTSSYTTPPTVLAIADQVWDEATSGHATAGSAGAKLTAAGAAGDPGTLVLGGYPPGTAGAAWNRIGTGEIIVVAPVSPDGKKVNIVHGDSYTAADVPLDFVDAQAGWEDLTGATIRATLVLRTNPAATLTITGSVLVASGAGKSVRLELTSTQTAALAVGVYSFDIQATLASGSKRTLVLGTWVVAADFTP